MNLNVSSTDSTSKDVNLASTERNSASISILFSDDENEKPSQALLTKIKTKKISPLKNPTSISDDIASFPAKGG